MPIESADIEWRYSGGAGNTDPSDCLGGAISTDPGGVVDTAVTGDLFDNVTGAEAGVGSTEYRGFYVLNAHGSDTMAAAAIFIGSNTSSTDDAIAIALADEAVSNAMETIADETTAPTGPVFSTPTDIAGALQLNSTTGLAPTEYKGVWIRRVVGAAAAPVVGNTATLSLYGEI